MLLLEPVTPVNDWKVTPVNNWKVHVKKQKQKWSRGNNAPVIKTKQPSEILAQYKYTKNMKRVDVILKSAIDF